ncbi:hypothetical protein LCGC14_1000710 [marine sediment metagenome]|uniref:Uncharacterized protein n=1 Tax=marine sediment metagenome TaxID=412755 RepID=A0A0F9N7X2_9ZZZZ
MKIRYKKGKKFDGDRIFTIETKGEEAFTHARLMVLINALAKNEYLIYKYGKWDEQGKDFLYEFALKDAIELGKKGIAFIDEENLERPILKEFCKRNELNFQSTKQTILNEFIKENENS